LALLTATPAELCSKQQQLPVPQKNTRVPPTTKPLVETRNPKQAILRARLSAQEHEAHWASAVMVLQT